MDESAAFTQCLEITRREAKNFYFGIRLLPTQKRKALSAIYALARLMDDIADGDQELESKRRALEQVRLKIGALIEGDTSSFGEDDPYFWGVYYAAQRYPIPLSALDELLDGCEQDVTGASYQTFADTESYCRLVAGTVGRLSLGIFGTDQPEVTYQLADDLGVALQLTNILRDVFEDLKIGRVYLPKEDLERFGVSFDLESDSNWVGDASALEQLIHFEAERAQSWYQRGFKLLDHLDRQSFACTASMAGIYFRIQKKIHKDPGLVQRGRVSVPMLEKTYVVGRSLLRRKPS